MNETVDYQVKMIKGLSAEEVNTVREALIKERQCVDLSMEDEQRRNWKEIVEFQYLFDRTQREAEFLKTLDLDRFRQRCLEVLPTDGAARKKLSVQVVNYGKEALEECEG